jgi:hypothetical protein
LDHGATKGIQIAENEKVTALVRGVENGARLLEKKGSTTEDTENSQRKTQGAAAGSMQNLANFGGDFSLRGLAECGV